MEHLSIDIIAFIVSHLSLREIQAYMCVNKTANSLKSYRQLWVAVATRYGYKDGILPITGDFAAAVVAAINNDPYVLVEDKTKCYHSYGCILVAIKAKNLQFLQFYMSKSKKLKKYLQVLVQQSSTAASPLVFLNPKCEVSKGRCQTKIEWILLAALRSNWVEGLLFLLPLATKEWFLKYFVTSQLLWLPSPEMAQILDLLMNDGVNMSQEFAAEFRYKKVFLSVIMGKMPDGMPQNFSWTLELVQIACYYKHYSLAETLIATMLSDPQQQQILSLYIRCHKARPIPIVLIRDKIGNELEEEIVEILMDIVATDEETAISSLVEVLIGTSGHVLGAAELLLTYTPEQERKFVDALDEHMGAPNIALCYLLPYLLLGRKKILSDNIIPWYSEDYQFYIDDLEAAVISNNMSTARTILQMSKKLKDAEYCRYKREYDKQLALWCSRE